KEASKEVQAAEETSEPDAINEAKILTDKKKQFDDLNMDILYNCLQNIFTGSGYKLLIDIIDIDNTSINNEILKESSTFEGFDG
ncbi:12577_t:CDS:2, partial [Dentiscutata heterogama]